MKQSFDEMYSIVAEAKAFLKENYPNFMLEFLSSRELDFELTLRSLATAKHESEFDSKATNNKSTARGLFQILKGTQQDIEDRILKIPPALRRDIFDPVYNAILGIGYIVYQFRRYKGDWQKAIIAYHLGSYNNSNEGNVYWNKHKQEYKKVSEMLEAYLYNPENYDLKKIVERASNTAKRKRNFYID